MAGLWVSYGELATVIGEDLARMLCRLRGGVSLHIPKQATSDAVLAPFIGLPALRALSSVYGGATITVPNKRKDEPRKGQVLDMLDAGMSARDIALQLDVTERYVRHVGASARPNIKQASLFDF